MSVPTRQSGWGGDVLVGVMALVTPIVAVQGPAHTTVLDAVNAGFLLVYWTRILTRAEPIELPLRAAMWLLLIGSLGGMVSAANRSVAVLTLVQDLYLYAWFVTLADFVTRHCRPLRVVVAWVAVACVVALLAALDAYLGLFGGHFAGDVRATGTFENPNMFGDYLMVSFFFAWAAAAAGWRIFYGAMAALVAGVLATASNGALLGLLVGGVATLLASPTAQPRRRVGALLLGVGCAVALFAVSFERVQEESLGMFAAPRGSIGGGAVKGYGERREVWAGLLESVRETPTGVGPGNFRTYTIAGDHSAHNEYLGMLAERGPLGLVAWLGVLLGAGREVARIRAARGRGYEPVAAAALLGLVAALAAHAAVVEMFHFRHVWFALALLVALRAQAPMAPVVASASGARAFAPRVLVEVTS
ncbi:MAG: O-antigen ligase family protein [Deltaproteobacteria bacterium]|nr:O-antigen ligase family protein [Deltaproteobacteria bacterium]